MFVRKKGTQSKTKKVAVMSYLKVAHKAINRVYVNSFASGINTKNDESVLPVSTAKNCYNFRFAGGALTGGFGLKNTTINAECAWTFSGRKGGQKTDTFMYYHDKKVYYEDNGTYKELSGVTLSSPPKAINYTLYGKDCVLICSPTDYMVVWDGENDAYYVENSPKITSMTMHYERLFVTTSQEKNTLYFSDDLDPTNWNETITEGGFIQMLDERGELLKVVSFLGYVYVFREHGISRVTAYADQTQFAVTHLFTASGRIFGDTIALCGDKVMFACDDGLYLFDGLSARKILADLDFIKADENSTAAYYEGKYYLAFKTTFGLAADDESDCVNNVILIYGDGYEIVKGYDVRRFCVCDKLYAVNATTLMTESANTLPKCWESPITDLGSAKRKRIIRLYLDTSGDIAITFIGDGQQKTVNVTGSDSPQKVRVDMTCRKFGIRITSVESNPKISRPQIYFSFTE